MFFNSTIKILLFLKSKEEKDELGFVPFEQATIKIYNSGDVQ